MSLTDLYRRMFRRAVATKRSKIRLNVTALEDRSVPASISGTVFYDTNHDGFQDNLEPGASGINVVYHLVNGDVAHGATTDAYGFYSFSDVSPGSYEVSFQPPANYTVGTPAGGSTQITVTDDVIQNASLVDSYGGPGDPGSPPTSPPPPLSPPPPSTSPPPPPGSPPGGGTGEHWISTSSTDWTDPANWSLGRAPVPSDDVYFDIAGSASTSNAGLGVNGLNSLHVLAQYTHTITLAVPLSIGTLEMMAGPGGTIDQPSTGLDLTLTTAFTWTSGTINSTSNLGNLILSGATGTIAPTSSQPMDTSPGTVNLGDNLTLIGGASLTENPGTVNVTNEGQTIDVGNDCSFNVGNGVSSLIDSVISLANGLSEDTFIVRPRASFTVSDNQNWQYGSDFINYGTVTIKPAAVAWIFGTDDTFYAYRQSGSTNFGATYLYGSSMLKTSAMHGISINGGTLATKYAVTEQGSNDCSATIFTDKLTIINGTYTSAMEVLVLRSGPCHATVTWNG